MGVCFSLSCILCGKGTGENQKQLVWGVGFIAAGRQGKKKGGRGEGLATTTREKTSLSLSLTLSFIPVVFCLKGGRHVKKVGLKKNDFFFWSRRPTTLSKMKKKNEKGGEKGKTLSLIRHAHTPHTHTHKRGTGNTLVYK
jgi:hypothetical protein